jgi:hypothetical protein
MVEARKDIRYEPASRANRCRWRRAVIGIERDSRHERMLQARGVSQHAMLLIVRGVLTGSSVTSAIFARQLILGDMGYGRSRALIVRPFLIRTMCAETIR